MLARMDECGYPEMLAKVRGLEEQLSQASEDTAMLDWLEKSYLSTEFWIKLGGESDLRTAIRKAMK